MIVNNFEHCNIHNIDEIRQGWKSTFNVTFRRARAAIVAVEKQ
jgi:hypothetical protein